MLKKRKKRFTLKRLRCQMDFDTNGCYLYRILNKKQPFALPQAVAFFNFEAKKCTVRCVSGSNYLPLLILALRRA